MESIFDLKSIIIAKMEKFIANLSNQPSEKFKLESFSDIKINKSEKLGYIAFNPIFKNVNQ